ncbi:hypothetical protein [Streptomyces sp. NPDC055186]
MVRRQSGSARHRGVECLAVFERLDSLGWEAEHGEWGHMGHL